MELITVTTIVGSFIFGAAIGFLTMGIGNSTIKVLIDLTGAIGLFIFLFAIMPTVSWGIQINEATQQVIDFTTTAVLAVASYVIADTFGSFGYTLITGFKE